LFVNQTFPRALINTTHYRHVSATVSSCGNILFLCKTKRWQAWDLDVCNHYVAFSLFQHKRDVNSIYIIASIFLLHLLLAHRTKTCDAFYYYALSG